MKASFRPLVIIALVVAAFSCASAPKTVPEGLTAREIIQKAQEASDKYDWSGASFYYKTALERFPDDIQTVCACEYEIAFVEYKNANYAGAKELLVKLLDRYRGNDAQLLPGQYKVLAQAILDKVDAALKAK
jgi:outer membrane protein assembly factor BamD (BamD/ComL family)